MTARGFIRCLLGLVAVGISAPSKALEGIQNCQPESPFNWCVRNLVFDDGIREQTTVAGTGVGKTLTNLQGFKWKIIHHPCRGLVVITPKGRNLSHFSI